MKIFMVKRDDNTVFLPYGVDPGSEGNAERYARANRHLGWEVLECDVVPVAKCNFCAEPAATIHKCPVCGQIPLCHNCSTLHRKERAAGD